MRMRTKSDLAVAGGDEAGDPEEGAFGFGVGQVGDAEAGGFGVGAGGVHGVVDGAVAVEDLEDLRVGDAVEAAVGEDGADGFAVGSGAALEGVDDGEGGLAFAEVGGYGLAEDLFGGGEVEDVVDDLEGEAEVAAVFAELGFDLVGVAEVVLGVMAAPSCMETLKRQAVLRKMRSKYSSSLMRWPSFCIWRSSPSTICWVSEMSRSRTRKLRSSRAVEKDCM